MKSTLSNHATDGAPHAHAPHPPAVNGASARASGLPLDVRPRCFPANFVWGVATAAPQIEGAATTDGKGLSNWDVFCRVPGMVRNDHTLDIACDHYARYETDLDLMAALGVRHYRFSIAWPRIFPDGRGAVNARGVAFYDRLIDALLARGITPWVTMFHWDLPYALERDGGWRIRRVVDAFAPYAELVVRQYGDRVKNWITLNEILCFTRLAYGVGEKAPGAKESEAVVNQTYHHALLCHGVGVRAVREFGGPDARVGLTDNPCIPVPVAETPEHIAAARSVFRTENLRVLDPIYQGGYDPAFLAEQGDARPKFDADDFKTISLPTDFLGLNIYTGIFVRAAADGRPEIVPFPRSYPAADSPWLKLNARAMYWGPRLAAEVYRVSDVCIMENGAGYDEVAPPDGRLLDLHRIEYVRSCLTELKRAIDDGVPVSGYFLWSLLDNFEWQDGYDRRFGIVHVDFETQRRTPKLSAEWYAQVIANHAIV